MDNELKLWQRYQQYFCANEDIGLTVDISRMNFDDGFFGQMEPRLQQAYRAMQELEKGAIANPDEQRMVGHYWLARSEAGADAGDHPRDRANACRMKTFVADVHGGKIKPQKAARFTDVLSIGIGGSALGPEFVHDALGQRVRRQNGRPLLRQHRPRRHGRVLDSLAGRLDQTLVLVITKSGGTPETHNGMLVAQHAYKEAGLDFAKHAVAITGTGSKMDQTAEKEGWLARFPMWDWIGGRTSETSAVGLLPAALQGIDIDQMLAGAAACDAGDAKRCDTKEPGCASGCRLVLGQPAASARRTW